MVSRRNILKLGALGGLAAYLPEGFIASASAQEPGMMRQHVAGYYPFKVGTFDLTVVTDGFIDIAPLLYFSPNADEERMKAALRDRFLPIDKITVHINVLVVDTGRNLVLIDTGSGHTFIKGTGVLSDSLQAAGIDPRDIDTVVLTHAHPDHAWGIINPQNRERFPNATYFIGQLEWDFWTDPTLLSRAPEENHGFIRGAQNSLFPIGHKIQRISRQTEVVSGITMMPTYGHTPGHHSVMIDSCQESLLCSADTLVHPITSFEYPEWYFGFDGDPNQAVTTRRRQLDMAASDQLRLLCYHLPYPGLGHVTRHGSAYRWIPEPWAWNREA